MRDPCPGSAVARLEPGGRAAGRLREITGGIVEDAVADGSARADATIDDIPMMMCAFGKVAALQQRGSGPPNLSWRRSLTIMLDGMRAR